MWFKVQTDFTACLILNVRADSEEEARKKVKLIRSQLTNEEFNEAISDVDFTDTTILERGD